LHVLLTMLLKTACAGTAGVASALQEK